MLHIAPSGKSIMAARRWETPCEVMFYLSEDTVSLLSQACQFFLPHVVPNSQASTLVTGIIPSQVLPYLP